MYAEVLRSMCLALKNDGNSTFVRDAFDRITYRSHSKLWSGLGIEDGREIANVVKECTSSSGQELDAPSGSPSSNESFAWQRRSKICDVL